MPTVQYTREVISDVTCVS